MPNNAAQIMPLVPVPEGAMDMEPDNSLACNCPSCRAEEARQAYNRNAAANVWSGIERSYYDPEPIEDDRFEEEPQPRRATDANSRRCPVCDQRIILDPEQNYACRCEQSRQLMAHDAMPGLGFHKTEHEMVDGRDDESRLYLGIELEVELAKCQKPLRDIIQALAKPWVYFKRDGSLSNEGLGGFEIVTHPLTPAFLYERKDEIIAWLKLMSSMGLRSFQTNTCGMHIHLSKKSFSSLECYKFMKLIYENPEPIYKIAQRSGNRLERYASLHTEDTRRMIRKARCMNENYGAERYVAVNVLPEHTNELRFFRGTLNPESFYKNIEFSLAAKQFSKETSIRRTSWDDFSNWTEVHSELYPTLANFMREAFSIATTDAFTSEELSAETTTQQGA